MKDGMTEDDRNELMPCEVKRFGRWNDSVVDRRQQMYYEEQRRRRQRQPQRFHRMDDDRDDALRTHFPNKPASNYMHVHEEEDGINDHVDDDDVDDHVQPRLGLPGDMYRGKVMEADTVGFENFTPDYASSSLSPSSSWESSVPAGDFSSTGVPTAPPVGMFLRDDKSIRAFQEDVLHQQDEPPQQGRGQEPFIPEAKVHNFSQSVRQETVSSPRTSTLVETSFTTSVPGPPPRGMFLNNNGPSIFGEDSPPPGIFGGGSSSNEPAVSSDDDFHQSQHCIMEEEGEVAFPRREEEASILANHSPRAPVDMLQQENTVATNTVAPNDRQGQEELVDAFPDNFFNGIESTKQEKDGPWTPPTRRSGPPPMGVFLQEELTWDIFNVASEQQPTVATETQPHTSGPPPVGMFLKERGEKSSFDGLSP